MRTVILFAITLAALAVHSAAAQPVIGQDAIRNAASFHDPTVPGGSIAQGSIFTIFGLDLGPAEGVHAEEFPLPQQLSGVRVSILGGAEPHYAYLLYVSATQINAILPSNCPLEKVQIVVSYLGESSPPAKFAVARRAPGIFSFLQNGRGRGIVTNYESPSSQPLNSPETPARPGQIVTIWVTGLGAIQRADNLPPSESGNVGHLWDFSVSFGETMRQQAQYAGRSAGFAGLDQVNVTIPLDAPLGCAVPVRISDLGMESNTVTMAITEDGEPCSTPGKTYYLDCASGDDSNDGLSEESPWGTLVRVNGTVFEPGDAILLKRGTHCLLQLYPKGSGRKEAPIRIGAYGSGPLPIVESTGEASVKLFNQEYWRIENIEVVGGTQYGIFINGNVSGTLHDIAIVDVVVHDVHGNLTTKNSGGIVAIPGSANTRFDGILVDGATVYNITQWTGIHLTGAMYRGRIPDTYGARIVVRNCVVHDVYGDGILLTMNQGGLMEKNVTWNTGMQPTLTLGTPSSMWFWFSVDSVVQFNEGFWSHSPGVDAGVFDIDWTHTRGTIQYNYGHDSDGYCFSVFGSIWTTNDSVVRYNLCTRNGLREDLARRQGAVFVSTWDGGSLDGVKIYNNTVIWDPPVDTYAVVNRASFVGQKSNIFANNLIVSTTPLLVDSNDRLRFNNNLYFYTGGQAPAWKYGNATYTSWDAYRTATGQDTHSMMADPKLVAPDYHQQGFPVESLRLGSDSPAIDAAQDVGEMGARDFFGNPVPFGPAYDIGASEYTATGPSVARSQSARSKAAFGRVPETAEFPSLTSGGSAPLARRGRWTLLTLTSAPCADEAASGPLRGQKTFLRSARRQFGAAGLDVRIVLSQPSCKADGRALANLPYDWALGGVELLLDDGRSGAAAVLRQGAPMATVLVNPEGEVVSRWSGFVLPQQLGLELQRRFGPPRP